MILNNFKFSINFSLNHQIFLEISKQVFLLQILLKYEFLIAFYSFLFLLSEVLNFDEKCCVLQTRTLPSIVGYLARRKHFQNIFLERLRNCCPKMTKSFPSLFSENITGTLISLVHPLFRPFFFPNIFSSLSRYNLLELAHVDFST